MIVETAIICATACIMCPLMSFLATILYDGIIGVGMYGASFTNYIANFIPFWLEKVVLNFPFALLSQVFFIQPLTRAIFRGIFKNKVDNKNSNKKVKETVKELAEAK